MMASFRSSLRDFETVDRYAKFPSDKSLGYCKSSLRDEIKSTICKY